MIYTGTGSHLIMCSLPIKKLLLVAVILHTCIPVQRRWWRWLRCYWCWRYLPFTGALAKMTNNECVTLAALSAYVRRWIRHARSTDRHCRSAAIKVGTEVTLC